jgi:hypothetical protein
MCTFDNIYAAILQSYCSVPLTISTAFVYMTVNTKSKNPIPQRIKNKKKKKKVYTSLLTLK